MNTDLSIAGSVTPKPIEQIAADLGYENHAFFRRLFKRSTGLTPGAYRRMFLPFIEPDRASDLAGKSLPLPADA